jgi:solute carrier family 13 (sodium-dependent dicarboxylate transporter), member 2/3/5
MRLASMGSDVHSENGSRWSMKRISLYIGPLLFIACLLIPNDPNMIEAAKAAGITLADGPKYGLGVLLWTATWWVFETTSLGLAALVPPILFSLVGLLVWKDALAPFMDPLIWVILVGFIFAKSFQVWGLDKRVALTLASVSKTRNPALAAFFVACLPVFLLTVTGSMTAATSIVYGFVIAFLLRQGFKQGSRYGSATMLALGQAATAGSLLFLTSTTTNLIGKNTVFTATGGAVNITFVDWFFIGTVHAFIGLFLTWFVVYRVIKPEVKELPFDPSMLKKELEDLGPITRGEKMTIGILVFTLLLWLIPGMVANFAVDNAGLQPLSALLAKVLPEAAPAAIALLLFPLLKAGDRPLLKWDEMLRESINWDIVFLVGGGITLGLGLMKSGFSNWIGILFRGFMGPAPNEFVIFGACCLIGFLLSYPASNTGAASVACPLAVSLSLAAGINPIAPVLGAAIATTIPSTLPSTTPAMAIAYSSGYVRMKDMIKVGMIADVIRFILLILIGLPLIKWFLAMRGFI